MYTIIYFCNFPGRIRPSQIHRNRPSYCVVSSFAVVLSWIHFNRSGFSHVRYVEVFLRGLHVSARQQADSGEQRQLLRQSGIDWVSSFRGPLLLDWEEVSEIAILLCVFSRCALIVHKKILFRCWMGSKTYYFDATRDHFVACNPLILQRRMRDSTFYRDSYRSF